MDVVYDGEEFREIRSFMIRSFVCFGKWNNCYINNFGRNVLY